MATELTERQKNRLKYIIQDKDGETVYKHYGDLNGTDFKIRKNKNSTIYILDYSNGMFVDDCEDCKIITGPITGSIFIRTCKNCTICTIATQVRFRDCENLKVFTYVKTDPAVENSFNIFFAPYNVFFPHLRELFQTAKFDKNEPNHIGTPYDFTVDAVLGGGAPHYGLLPKEEFYIEEINEGGLPEEMYEGYADTEELIKEKRRNDNDFIPINVDEGNNQGLFSGSLQTNAFDFNQSNTNTQMMGGFDFTSDVPLGMNDNMKQQVQQPQQQQHQQLFVEDEEEIQRQQLRQEEMEQRAKVIREKMEIELQKKNELREKALEYLNTFNQNRMMKISENKKNNIANEERMNSDKQIGDNETKSLSCSWNKVTQLISMKESEYKGSKDVSRMRECIIKRKNDAPNNK